jgi:hypothetical protein
MRMSRVTRSKTVGSTKKPLIKAITLGLLPSAKQLSTIFAADVEIFQNGVKLTFVYGRADVGIRIITRAEPKALRTSDDLFDKFVSDLIDHNSS